MVAYIISHISCQAEAWATAGCARDSPICSSVELFTNTLCKILNHTTVGPEEALTIIGLHQGSHQVSDYAIELSTLPADSGWNIPSLLVAFQRRLSETIMGTSLCP